jgi:hypothetical protein
VSTTPVAVMATVGGRTIGGRLAAARRRAFVGRASELDLFRSALSDDLAPFAVLFLHGPGGIGKSALLRRLADEAEQQGRIAVLLDCRVAGSPSTLLPELSTALGLDSGDDPGPALYGGTPIVLLLDTYEAAPGLDGWLRDVLLPDLPAGALVVIAGRDPPAPAWRDDPGWHDLLRVVALRNLAPADARALLETRKVPPQLHERTLALAGGHPLALALLADVVAQTGAVPETHEEAPDVVSALLERFASDAPTALHRRALQVCAHARHTTQALLADLLPAADADTLFAWLRGLSFIEPSPYGLVPHDLARDVLDADLRWRDDDAYRQLHRQIRDHLVTRLRTTRGSEQERIMREVQYLHRHNPLFRPYLTWEDTGAVTTRPLRGGDAEVLAAMAETFEGPASADVVAFWARRRPEAFQVFQRAGEEGSSGFATFLELATPTDEELQADPVVAEVFATVVPRASLRPGDHVWVGRHFVFRHAYGLPCPEFDLVQLRSGLRWLNDRRLAWSVVAVPAAIAAFWEPEMHYLDMARLGEAGAGRDLAHGWVLFGRDWRAGPADSWLELMAERELDVDLDPDRLADDPPPRLNVLAWEEFAAAVREALREANQPERLAANPLARSRVVRDHLFDDDPGRTLADLLVEAVDALRGDERGDRLHRAVATTYFKRVPTQEAAAERLGLPFSTYRRHLTAGTEQVTAWLWERELHGTGDAAGPDTGTSSGAGSLRRPVAGR